MLKFLKGLFGGGSSSEDAAVPEIEPPRPQAVTTKAAKKDEDASDDDDGGGAYVSFTTAMLPQYVRHGHGMLVLRDLYVDELIVDGVSMGDPKSTDHPHFTGGFRGYFNVPFGPHTLIAKFQGKTSTWSVDLERNGVAVKRIDWEASPPGWADDEPKAREQYERLASSGSMLQSKTLRPWPHVALYFQNAPSDLSINGTIVAKAAAFPSLFGVINLAPGAYTIASASLGYSERVTMPAESMQIIDLGPVASGSSKEAKLVDARIGDMLLRSLLMRAREGALILASDLLAKPGVSNEALATAAQANLDIMKAVLGSGSGSGSGVPTFGPADLASVKAAFESYRSAPSDAALNRYVDGLKRHYILDSEMGKQASYFAQYADEIARHIQSRPELTKTSAKLYFDYLAQDLADAGSPALATKAEVVTRALESSTN